MTDKKILDEVYKYAVDCDSIGSGGFWVLVDYIRKQRDGGEDTFDKYSEKRIKAFKQGHWCSDW